MKKYNNISVIVGLLAMAGAVAIVLLDRETATALISSPQNWIIGAFVLLIVVALIAILNALDTMKNLVLKEQGHEIEEEEDIPATESSFLKGLMQKLTKSTPVEREAAIDMNHSYDGIRELDNSLPPWWLYGFYISIIWGIVYVVRVHVLDTEPTPLEEYKIEMAQAEADREAYLKTVGNLVDENNVAMLTEESKIQEGQAIFMKHCAVCHQKDGGGSVGPNLTDAYWIHGNDIKDIFSTIKYGVPTKMISWQDQLNPSEMQKVASFIKTLEGTTPQDPKEPQGQLIKDENEDDAASDSTATTAENGTTASL